MSTYIYIYTYYICEIMLYDIPSTYTIHPTWSMFDLMSCFEIGCQSGCILNIQWLLVVSYVRWILVGFSSQPCLMTPEGTPQDRPLLWSILPRLFCGNAQRLHLDFKHVLSLHHINRCPDPRAGLRVMTRRVTRCRSSELRGYSIFPLEVLRGSSYHIAGSPQRIPACLIKP